MILSSQDPYLNDIWRKTLFQIRLHSHVLGISRGHTFLEAASQATIPSCTHDAAFRNPTGCGHILHPFSLLGSRFIVRIK